MAQTIRVSLPGYDALTETNPDRFALYADQNWVLIKELTRGSVTVPGGQYRNVTHNLGYIPTIFAFYQDQGVWKSLTGQYNEYGDFTNNNIPRPYVAVFTNVVSFFNQLSNSVEFKYFICYDNQV